MLKRLLHQLFGAQRASVAELIERGRAEREQGAAARSLASFEAALRLDEGNAQAWAELGLSQHALGRADEARAAFARAAAIDPRWAAPRMYLGNLAHEAKRLDEAVDAYRAALALDDADAALHYNLALTLMLRGEAPAAVDAFRRCLALAPDYADARSSLLFALNLSATASAEETAAEHFEWGRRMADPLTPERRFANAPEAERRLRIGYVSADFFDHAASDFIHSFLPHHHHAGYAVVCYANCAVPEAKRNLYGHTWRDIRTLDDDQAARQIGGDAIDILVDLSGHSRGNRLLAFARKPAPLQLTFLGYPNTTGMRAMDFRLTDAYADPPGKSESRYRERLLRLPASLWCYQAPPDQAAEVGPLPAIRKGYITFGSMNNVVKLNADLVGLWAELLSQLPEARLLLATIPPGEARARLLAVFAEKGIAAGRVECVDRLSRNEFRALHREIDIALDSYPCNGGATSCETLWLGVPVVTLVGDAFQSRAGLSQLSALGLPQLAATTRADYLAVARGLAQDLPALVELRAGLRQKLRDSRLCDAPAYTRALEALYRGIWREWCAVGAGQSAASRPAQP